MCKCKDKCECKFSEHMPALPMSVTLLVHGVGGQGKDRRRISLLSKKNTTIPHVFKKQIGGISSDYSGPAYVCDFACPRGRRPELSPSMHFVIFQ